MQVNYPNDHDFTAHRGDQSMLRASSFPKPRSFGNTPMTSARGKEPYYPIPAPDAKAVYDQYAALAAQEEKVSFVGRLATLSLL